MGWKTALDGPPAVCMLPGSVLTYVTRRVRQPASPQVRPSRVPMRATWEFSVTADPGPPSGPQWVPGGVSESPLVILL